MICNFNNSRPVDILSYQTHTYDGKLPKTAIRHLNIIRSYPLDKKKKIIEGACQYVKNQQALYYLKLIIDGAGTSANYDPTNDLWAEDLLYLCIGYFNQSDFLILFEEQLRNMATGSCPQGRTHRLYQLLKAYQ